MAEEQEVSNFEKLPLELQLMILENNPEMVQKYRLINRSISALIEKEYKKEKELCTKPITLEEIISYVETKPKVFCLYETYETLLNGENVRVMNSYIFREGPVFDIYYERQIFEYIIYKLESKDLINKLRKELIDNNFNPNDIVYYKIYISRIIYPKRTNNIVDFIDGTDQNLNEKHNRMITIDLMSKYNIYSKRLSCTNINPNYAKTMVLDQLNYIYNNVSQKKNYNINRLLEAYIKLSVDAYILNINFIPVEQSFGILSNGIMFILQSNDEILYPQDQRNIRKYISGIDYLYPRIKNKILNL